MADPVAAPAAPQPASAPAAPTLKPNEAMVPFEIGNLTHDSVDEDAPIETPPEATETPPAEETPPPVAEDPEKAARLKEIEDARVERDHFRERYANSKKFRLAYIEDCVERGVTLTPEQRTELDASKAAPVADPNAPPRYTRKVVLDTIATESAKMEAEGKSLTQILAYRDSMIERWIHEPELADAKAEREKEKAEQAKVRAAEEQRGRMGQIRNELAAAAEQYKELVVADPSLPQGYRITNDKVFAEVAKLMSLQGETMASRIDLALYRLKMQPPKQTAAKPGVKPTVPVSAARTTPPARKLKPNEHAMPAFIVGEENFQ